MRGFLPWGIWIHESILLAFKYVHTSLIKAITIQFQNIPSKTITRQFQFSPHPCHQGNYQASLCCCRWWKIPSPSQDVTHITTFSLQKSKAFEKQLGHFAAAKQEPTGTKSLNYDNNKGRHNMARQSIVIPRGLWWLWKAFITTLFLCIYYVS